MTYFIKKRTRVLTKRRITRSIIWFFGAFFCLLTILTAPIIGSWIPYDIGWQRKVDPVNAKTLKELQRLGILTAAPFGSVKALMDHQRTSGKTLAEILGQPSWARRLGLTSEPFRSTWYISNPFDLLPADIQTLIQQRKHPFKSRTHVWEWCRTNRIPKKWKRALYAALIETTPENLWRASQGKRPVTKSGYLLRPIVVDQGGGAIKVQDGHIATDPNVIPTGSDILIIVKIQGKDRLLKVKAADVGAAIKGRHVDLPIHVGPEAKNLPETRLPKKYIRNRTIRVLRYIPQI